MPAERPVGGSELSKVSAAPVQDGVAVGEDEEKPVCHGQSTPMKMMPVARSHDSGWQGQLSDHPLHMYDDMTPT